MKGYRLNEDKDYVFKIIEGTHRTKVKIKIFTLALI